MIVRLPSLVKSFDVFWSGDPAFVQLGPNATDAEQEAYAHRWKVARDTGDHSALLVDGAQPTKFIMRPLSVETFAALVDMARAKVGTSEVATLAFRIALESVSNLDGIEVKHEIHPRFGKIASTSFFGEAGIQPGDALPITSEVGGVMLDKASPSRPS